MSDSQPLCDLTNHRSQVVSETELLDEAALESPTPPASSSRRRAQRPHRRHRMEQVHPYMRPNPNFAAPFLPTFVDYRLEDDWLPHFSTFFPAMHHFASMVNSEDTYEQLLALDEGIPKPKASSEQMSRFPIIPVERDACSIECTVCLEPITDQYRLLSCLHRFHVPCIDKWMTECKPSCPTCVMHVNTMLGSEHDVLVQTAPSSSSSPSTTPARSDLPRPQPTNQTNSDGSQVTIVIDESEEIVLSD
eukprot:c2886_g1_i1.p1 GENE.c2886_g1_i1~~c2886_g1_i1.p1  ORF type:complete len:287 (+),score=45.35 c2886_g1_i1:118-861(+)